MARTPLPAQPKAESGTVSSALPMRTWAPPGPQPRMMPRTGSPSWKKRFQPGRLALSGVATERHALLAEAPAPVHGAQALAHGVVGGGLPDRVDGGGHLQAAFQHPVAAVLLVEVLAHFLHRVGGDRLLLGVLPGQPDGPVHQGPGVALLQVALRDHAPEHVVAPGLGRRPGLAGRGCRGCTSWGSGPGPASRAHSSTASWGALLPK